MFFKNKNNNKPISEEELDNFFGEIKKSYEDDFIKHYFKKEKKDLTQEDKHTMDCYGSLGMAEWCLDNIKEKRIFNMTTTKIILSLSVIFVIVFTSFFVLDYNRAEILHNKEVVVINKKFIEKKTFFNPAILIVQTKEQHYDYNLKIDDNLNYYFQSNENNLEINQKIKVDFKIGYFSKQIYDFKITKIN